MRWIIAVVMVLGLIVRVSVAAEPRIVTVRTVKLRVEPKPWAASSGILKYGDQVELLSVHDGWARVKSRVGQGGYLHESAITQTALNIPPISSLPDRSSSDVDIVMAGKGFDASLERSAAAADETLNFRAVDMFERKQCTDAELRSFMVQGRLGGLSSG